MGPSLSPDYPSYEEFCLPFKKNELFKLPDSILRDILSSYMIVEIFDIYYEFDISFFFGYFQRKVKKTHKKREIFLVFPNVIFNFTDRYHNQDRKCNSKVMISSLPLNVQYLRLSSMSFYDDKLMQSFLRNNNKIRTFCFLNYFHSESYIFSDPEKPKLIEYFFYSGDTNYERTSQKSGDMADQENITKYFSSFENLKRLKIMYGKYFDCSELFLRISQKKTLRKLELKSITLGNDCLGKVFQTKSIEELILHNNSLGINQDFKYTQECVAFEEKICVLSETVPANLSLRKIMLRQNSFFGENHVQDIDAKDLMKYPYELIVFLRACSNLRSLELSIDGEVFFDIKFFFNGKINGKVCDSNGTKKCKMRIGTDESHTYSITLLRELEDFDVTIEVGNLFMKSKKLVVLPKSCTVFSRSVGEDNRFSVLNYRIVESILEFYTLYIYKFEDYTITTLFGRFSRDFTRKVFLIFKNLIFMVKKEKVIKSIPLDLNYLVLNHNVLSGDLIKKFSPNLKVLKEVIYDKNTTYKLSTFQNLRNLERLWLNFQEKKFEKEHLRVLNQMTNLKEFTFVMFKGYFQKDDAEELDLTLDLIKFDLTTFFDRQISDEEGGPRHLVFSLKFPKLKLLYLEYVNLDYSHILNLSNNTDLKKLTLKNCELLSSIDFTLLFKRLKNLKIFRLFNNNVSEEKRFYDLAPSETEKFDFQCSALEEIRLENVLVNYSFVKGICKLRKIKKLYLVSCGLKEKHLNYLYKFSKWKNGGECPDSVFLDVHDNKRVVNMLRNDYSKEIVKKIRFEKKYFVCSKFVELNY